jgi:hypothetical protein
LWAIIAFQCFFDYNKRICIYNAAVDSVSDIIALQSAVPD